MPSRLRPGAIVRSDIVRPRDGKNGGLRYNESVKPDHLFSRFRNEAAYELPFFIFLTCILVGIAAFTIYDTPAVREPLRLVAYCGLMLVHIALYWLGVELVTGSLRRSLAYLGAQAALAFSITLLGGNLANGFGLYMGLIGMAAGMLKLTRVGIAVILGILGLGVASYVINAGWVQASWMIISVLPMTVFVIVYVLLYSRQSEARAKAQQLLTELESAHRQLAEYADQVEELTLANERQRMARELHDTLSQGLAGLILQLEAAQAHLNSGRSERAGGIIAQAMLQARATLADARRAIGDLRQAGGEPDLETEVRRECERFSGATGIPCQLQLNLPGPLPAGLTEAARRVVAEGLTNVARHARAASCQVSLRQAGGELVVRVADDGAGFDPAAEKPGGHYGLLGMRERARLAGGTLSVTSQPGAGTAIELRLPLPPDARGAL